MLFSHTEKPAVRRVFYSGRGKGSVFKTFHSMMKKKSSLTGNQDEHLS